MTIMITVKTENAAFEEDKQGEVARILAAMIEDWPTIAIANRGELYDINGNNVGFVTVTGT